MKRPGSSPSLSARARLLAAASRVFARDGLAGATTREIAREAGVNEVTLFRLFKTKDLLLGAVVGEKFAGGVAAPPPDLPAPTRDLRRDLLALAALYDRLLEQNLPLVRTMIGEIHHRHHGHERQVFESIFLPVKDAFLQRLAQARRDGAVRRNARPEVLTDLLVGMIFTGVLRRANAHHQPKYTAASYRAEAVALVIQGAAVGRSPA